MTVDAHKNFAYSTVATAPSPASSGTSLVVQSGDGTKFPAVSFNATVWPVGVNPTSANAEIVRVTAISTDTFTITRAQESSSARSIVVGDQIANTETAKTFTDIENNYIEGSGAKTGDQTYSFSSTAAAKIVLRGNSSAAGSKMVSRDFWTIGPFAETFVNSTAAISMLLGNGGAGLTYQVTDILTSNGYYAPSGNFVTTTNATQTTLSTISTSSNLYYFITTRVIARDITNGKQGVYFRTAAFTNDAGTLTQTGSTQTIGTDIEDIAGWDVTIDSSGTDIRVRVTGAASTTIKWFAYNEVMSNS